jgi:hypothetical protein
MVLPSLLSATSSGSFASRQRPGASNFFFEVPAYLNSDGEEKFRDLEWLISTIMLEINHLKG